MLALALLLALQAPPTTATTSTTTCRVAVMDLENLPKVLTEALAASVADASGCEVVTRQDIASMVDFEAERAACGGNVSDSCLSEIGNALGVDRMVAGSVARVGSSTTVTARLLNLKVGKVEARAEETTADASDLRKVSQLVGRRLFGKGGDAVVVADVAPAAGGPSVVLLVGGGGIAALGLVGVVTGGAVALDADPVLTDPTSSRKEKDDAIDTGIGGIVIAAGGALVVVIGAGVAGLAFVLE